MHLVVLLVIVGNEMTKTKLTDFVQFNTRGALDSGKILQILYEECMRTYNFRFILDFIP